MKKDIILRKKVSFTLTSDAMILLKSLSEKKGISMAGILELIIRDEAKREKIKLDA